MRTPMNIKINTFSPLSYAQNMEIVAAYCKKNQKRELTKNGAFGTLQEEFHLEDTGKHPIKFDFGHSNFFIKCRKTKTFYVFDIWKAS